MNHKNRLAKLEKRQAEAPAQRVKVIEIYGTREDGTRYLLETLPQMIEAGPLTYSDGAPVDENYQRTITTLGNALREITGNEP